MKKLLTLLAVLMVLACGLAIGVSAANPDDYTPDNADGVAEFYLVPESMEDDQVVFDLYVDAKNYDITQFGAYIDYSENLALSNVEFVGKFGSFVQSEMIDTKPFLVLWVSGVKGLTDGDVAMVRFTFDIVTPLGPTDTFDIHLDLDPENPPANVDGDELDYKDCAVVTFRSYNEEDFVVVIPECDTNVGDSDGNGKVNLGDASIILKHVAKWKNLSIDLDQADTNNDEKVNLGDVSMILKYVAKWNTVRLGHNDYLEVIIPATCQHTGETMLTCKNCPSSVTVTTSIIPCSYNKKVEKEVTCGADGLERYTCTMCSDSYTKTIKATGKHNYVKSTVTAPTCGKDGTDKYTCSVCKDSYTKTTKATGKHNYVKSTVTAPTCVKKGTDKYTCSVCGDYYTKEVAATGKHNYKKTTVTAPTCAKAGNDKYTCSMCGDNYTKSVAATGVHKYSNGKCTMCGKADPNASTQTDLQKFCTWLTKNGTYNDGCYYIKKISGNFSYTVSYITRDNTLTISHMWTSTSSFFAAAIEVPLDGSKIYDFSYYRFSNSGTVYIMAGEEMTAKEFCSKTKLDFDYAFSDIYDYYTDSDETDAWEDLDFTLKMCASLIKNANTGTGFTLSDLGFIGY